MKNSIQKEKYHLLLIIQVLVAGLLIVGAWLFVNSYTIDVLYKTNINDCSIENTKSEARRRADRKRLFLNKLLAKNNNFFILSYMMSILGISFHMPFSEKRLWLGNGSDTSITSDTEGYSKKTYIEICNSNKTSTIKTNSITRNKNLLKGKLSIISALLLTILPPYFMLSDFKWIAFTLVPYTTILLLFMIDKMFFIDRPLISMIQHFLRKGNARNSCQYLFATSMVLSLVFLIVALSI